MSMRRTRATTSTDDDLKELVLKLQALIPQSTSIRCTRKVTAVSATKILKETCNYIKKLNREVDDISDRLSRLLDSMTSHSADVDILRSLLQR